MDPSAFGVGPGDDAERMPTILVVDDDHDVRVLLQIALETEGYRVVTARNGAEALEQLERERPAIILLDMMMPVMSGPQFREEQLRRLEYSGIPVVYMSAVYDGWCCDGPTGAAAFLRKPFDLDKLIMIVSVISAIGRAVPPDGA